MKKPCLDIGKKPNIKIVRLLLEHGAAQSLDTRSNGARNPLLAATDSGNIEVVQLLIDYGAAKCINTCAGCDQLLLQIAIF